MRETVILTDALIRNSVNIDDVIQVVRDALIAYAGGKAQMPAKIYLELPGGDLRAMPAYVEPLNAAGVKVVNVHPDNHAKGLPAVMATYLLLEPETGFPLAVMGATALTAMRTGAVAALSTQALAAPDAKVLAIIGAGAQAHTQLDAHLEVMPHLQEVRVYAPLQPELDAFREKHFASLTPRGIGLMTEDHSVRKVVDGADVIVTVTPGRQVVLKADMVKPGAHICAMGADAPGKQEIDPALLKAGKVVVDDIVQAVHSGEINVPIRRGQFNQEDLVGTLGDTLSGKTAPRTSLEDITIFDSTGLAIQDAALAGLLFRQLRHHKNAVNINLVQ